MLIKEGKEMSSKTKQNVLGLFMNISELFFKVFLSLLMVAIIIILPLQVFCRFLLQSSLSWPDEIASYVLVWITFIGAALALIEGEHISFDGLTNKMSGNLKFSVIVFRDLISIGFFSILFFFGIPIVIIKWPDPTISLPISKGLFYMCIPLGSAFMLIISIVSLFRTIKGFHSGSKSP